MQTLKHTGISNLFRCEASGIYYAIVKSNGKQKRRNLKTTDKEIGRRKMEDFRRKVARLTTDDARKMPFAEYDEAGLLVGGLVKRWWDANFLNWKPRTRERETYTIRHLCDTFRGRTVKEVTQEVVQKWQMERAATCAPATFNRERLRLKEIFAYAVDKGLVLDDPTAEVPKLGETRKALVLPTDAQVVAILREMRGGKGKRRARDSADLLEGLSSLGCRQDDAAWIEWQHADFEAGTITINGHPETGTKNGTGRTILLFKPLRRLLLDMRAALPRPPAPTDRIFQVRSCRTAFETACRRLNLPPHPPHHTWRRMFVTHCLKAGIDAKTIAKWIGHSDEGVLILTRYAILDSDHDRRMAERVVFDVAKYTIPPANPPPPEQGGTADMARVDAQDGASANNIIPFPSDIANRQLRRRQRRTRSTTSPSSSGGGHAVKGRLYNPG